jgi:S-adenosylmethionine hydrolase
MRKKNIVLITDFGHQDPYVGVVKGVIKTINPYVNIIDLTHNIRRQDIYEAGIVLMVSYKYFPRNSIFTCVVDPGVGSSRRAIIVKSRNYLFVGPDNGCLYPAAYEDGLLEAYDISDTRFRLRELSGTFHGRDLFAPVAAYLSIGIPPEVVGSRINTTDIHKIEIPQPTVRRGEVKGRIIYIDTFGNIMTNVSANDVLKAGFKYGEVLEATIGERRVRAMFVPSFSRVAPGELAVYLNSWGYLELGVYMDNAQKRFSSNVGDDILIRLIEK